MQRSIVYAILVLSILCCYSCGGPRYYIPGAVTESGRDSGFNRNEYIKQGTTTEGGVYITSDSATVMQRISEEGFLEKIPPEPRYKGLSTMGRVGYFTFYADSLDTVTYVVVFDSLGKRIAVGIIEIPPSSDPIKEVSTGLVYAHFNKSVFGVNKKNLSVTYDIYGFLGDSVIVIRKLYL